MSPIIERISREVISGYVQEEMRDVKEALRQEISAHEILDDGLMPAMEKAEVLFQGGEIFILDVFFPQEPCTGQWIFSGRCSLHRD